MGRFDVLTQLDKKPLLTTSLPEQAEPGSPSVAENKVASKPVYQQGSKEVSQQTSLPANIQTSKKVNKQTSLPTNQQGSKLLKKFSSYLTEESLRGMKRIAFETDQKDYEVLQEAVDQYLASKQS